VNEFRLEQKKKSTHGVFIKGARLDSGGAGRGDRRPIESGKVYTANR
jgi:hypothetical protein